jgi:peroxiredoxin Q/BCP
MWWLLMGGALAGSPMALAAQADSGTVKVGDMAPDFTLPVATRDSVWKIPARLRDFRGQTVILAFFFKVRTGG